MLSCITSHLVVVESVMPCKTQNSNNVLDITALAKLMYIFICILMHLYNCLTQHNRLQYNLLTCIAVSYLVCHSISSFLNLGLDFRVLPCQKCLDVRPEFLEFSVLGQDVSRIGLPINVEEQ